MGKTKITLAALETKATATRIAKILRKRWKIVRVIKLFNASNQYGVYVGGAKKQ